MIEINLRILKEVILCDSKPCIPARTKETYIKQFELSLLTSRLNAY